MANLIQIRRDTAANWTSANPVLAQGELGAETDTLKIKMGNGSTAWNSLGYLIDTGSYATVNSFVAGVRETRANTNTSVWVGTQAQYDAIGSKSATTLYFITG